MSGQQKQLLNSTESCVDEMLEGVAAVNLNVRILKGHRVVVRTDIEGAKKKGQVTILSGGGSGHEPFAAGFVGKGMLSAAVAGSVFTSPPPNQILAGIRAISCPSGVLLIVANYTGDRLNFGIAAERAAAENIKIATITIGEDCALTSTDKTAGRRGLCGIVLLMKIVGALAEEGRSLEEIAAIGTETINAVGTIGVSLSPCHVPGSGATFTLGEDEMELGLGVHGEAGVKRMKVMQADDIAAVMIDHMTEQTNSSHMTISSGDRVALVLNNLGATSYLEMFVMVRAVIRYLESKGVIVERVYVDHFMTSLDMAGLSLTILHLTDLRLKCLDKDTTAIGWKNGSTSSGTTSSTQRGRERLEPCVTTSKTGSIKQSSASPNADTSAVLCALENICKKLIESESLLNELDRHGGDGDCGTTLKTGAQGILALLDGFSNYSVYAILISAAESLENTMGGASGGLYSLFLTAAAGKLRTDTNPPSWIDALYAGMTAVSRYGGAEPGDRTMRVNNGGNIAVLKKSNLADYSRHI
ncbi:triokinase/FMN cyclase-like isoform X2 [Antedon mediterranea]|uniref:triokinase/FMN cyclase-like isoform X2 n=1 Tax=Antedon mediterranea TaxID=105859 RepID=UPI003AF672FC